MTKLKASWLVYGVTASAMLAISLFTGRRASVITGVPHYLLTRTQVFVEAVVEPTDATDAAMDALFDEAGEATTLTVARPMFVLGLLDATGPVTVFGLVVLTVITLISRHRNNRVTVMEHTG